MLDELRPPHVPKAVIRAFAEAFYGIAGDLTPMEGERDLNHRIGHGEGGGFILKLCQPAEGVAIPECQAAALEHIAAVDPSLPVPRLVRARDGSMLSSLSHGGIDYPVMVLEWLEGRVLGTATLRAPRLFELGSMLARLGLALRGFVSGAPAQRELVWDTSRVSHLAPYTSCLDPQDQDMANRILAFHAGVTAPAMRKMRSQIIHGDIHPYNVLIQADGQVSGLIDFGDMVHGPLILDLANAASDFLSPDQKVEETITALVKGYHSVIPLEETEADALVDLIQVRLLMTPLIDALKRAHGISPQGYFEGFNGRSLPMIRALEQFGIERLRSIIRRAAAFPAQPSRHPATLGDAIARRRRVMGEKLYVFYDPPLHIIKGEGVWLTASDGRRYLDCYNNVPHVGHCHPYVTAAIARQAGILCTNTRYITDQSVEYAERLVQLAGDDLTAVVFVNSGSEANDLAWRMAKAFTGSTGGLAMDFAYHGVSEAIDAFSPSNSPGHWNAPHVRLLPPPDTYRGPYGSEQQDAGQRYAALADPLIDDLFQKGFGLAAAMIDSAFMTNGMLDAPAWYLAGIVQKVQAAGGLFIADEVQSGFGRMGSAFWGHSHHKVKPDFITIGKPAGNGHPIGAVITRPDILSHFLSFGPFFSTFGGNNVSCAAGLAVLDVIRDEELVANAYNCGNHLRDGLRDLMDRHAIIGDVRGVGLATGVELVKDRANKNPAASETARLLSLLRDEGVLIGSEGKFANILKIRPPIVFTRDHADLAVAAVDRALARL